MTLPPDPILARWVDNYFERTRELPPAPGLPTPEPRRI